MRLISFVLPLALVLDLSCSAVDRQASKTLANGVVTQKPKKVMIVVYENQGYSAAMAQPFFKSLTQRGALLTNFFALAHPSQGNYIALISGDFQGVTDDKNHDLNASHIGDLLEAHGKTWKNYAEGDPGPCYQQEKSGSYVRKHVPFISFVNVQNSPARCAKIVPATQLAKDIQDGTLPDFSFYSPDLKNDGHDTGIAYADKALKSTFEPLLNNPKFMKDMLLVVTFDEDDRHEGNKIFTALIGESVIPGAQDNSHYDHYSLLRTVEDLLDIGTLHQHDEHAVPITGVWVP